MNQVPNVNPITDSSDMNRLKRALLHGSPQKLERMENVPVQGFNSNLLTVTDAKSQQTIYTYSNMNRTGTRKDPLLHTEIYS